MNSFAKSSSHLLVGLVVASGPAAFDTIAAEPAANIAALRARTNFILRRVYSAEEDQEVLRTFEGLRVADVCDGMDAVGLHNRGLVDPDIHPLWRDTKNYTHRRKCPRPSGPFL